MPLRCVNAAGEQIHSFALDTEQWTMLKAKNRANKHLIMPCCSVGVVLKTSPLGTRFFAHSRRGDCASKPESAEHLMLKSKVAMAIAAAGWQVATEVRGHSREGQLWIADVMATRGNKQFAVEIQLSKQSHEVTVERHFRYKSSGVRCLWLFRQKPIRSSSVPAMQVTQDKNGEFAVLIGNPELMDPIMSTIETTEPANPARVPVEAFIACVFSGSNLWFGVFRKGHRVQIRLSGSDGRCRGCLGDITVVTRLRVIDPISGACLSVEPYEMASFSTLLDQLNTSHLQRHGIGPFRRTSYWPGNDGGLTNTCPHCSAWTGQAQRDWNDPGETDRFLFNQEVEITREIEGYTRLSSNASWQIDLVKRLPGSGPAADS